MIEMIDNLLAISGRLDRFAYHEFAGQANIHPLGLAMVIVLGALTVVLKRQYAVLPFIIMACMIPPGQRFVFINMDFTLLRVLVFFGFFRIAVRNEWVGFRWRSLDWFVLLWSLVSIATFTMLRGSADALINRLGAVVDSAAMYFVFRCLVRDWRDLVTIIVGFAALSIPVAIFFLIERATGRNIFSVFGGVPEFTMERDGRMRCQGAFAHPILAGCFWASLVPLFGALLWWRGILKWCGAVGAILSIVIVINTASSTPLMALIFAFAAIPFFYVRQYMIYLFWFGVLLTVALHFSMKAPVWHLIARINVVGGSTSWHRFNLMNQTIIHWQDWFLLGTVSTLAWGITDITNQYCLEAIRGGIMQLGLFIAILFAAYFAVGRIWRRSERSKPHLVMAWALGIVLFVHTTSFIGVSYFGQIVMLWYLHLAIIQSIAVAVERPPLSRARTPSPLPNGRQHARGSA